ncbi:MAG: sialate O-acetylesterase, partial [Verrucomicrobiota bacterium]
EVRICKIVRSADWVKMEYESQKPLQTLVGPLVQPVSNISVSADQITLLEGQSATLTATAGGAQKLYWVIKKDGMETIADVDQHSYKLSVGRVTGDQSFILQWRAVYANEVKTKDIAVTVKEAIPEPVVALKAPSKWNGRDTIEVVPDIGNLSAMTAKGVGELHCQWTVTGGAVTKEIVPGKLILKRSHYTGPITVRVAIDNGGAPTIATVPIEVSEPKNDPWVQRIAAKDEKPEDGQFYARDDLNEGTLFYNGTLDKPAADVFLKLYADDKLIKTETVKPAADNSYSLTTKLKAGMIKYKVEFGTKSATSEKLLQSVGNLVCGDAYLIEGQSNALATDTGDKSPAETNEWIRSYGGPTGWGDATDWVRDQFDKIKDTTGNRPNLWCNAVWKRQKDEKAELGWWGMELAKNLLASQKVPICIIQAAAGGTRIDQHQPGATNHMSLATIYGRMLWRVEQAKLTHGIRAVLWHQGEADQGSDGPDNGYDSTFYQQYFIDMSAAWKQDMPNIQHYYVFQIWPNGCSQGGGHGDLLREKQRTLSRLYANLDVMSTLGIKPPGGCHYPLTGWSEFARLMQPLIERDFYGRKVSEPITAPDLKQAYYASSAKDAIILEFDQPVIWLDSLAGQFYLDDAKDRVAKGSVNGNVITLQLKAPATAGKITYLKELNWNQNDLVFGKNGIAALTFCDVPIANSKESGR